MGQLGTLLWRNYQAPLGHPVRTALVFFSVIIFAGPLIMIAYLSDGVEQAGDCDFVSMAMPPSHPFHLVSSLLCHSSQHTCHNTTHYAEPKGALRRLTGEDKVDGVNMSRLCPGRSEGQVRGSFAALAFTTCKKTREADTRPRQIPSAALIFRGQLLFHPDTAETRAVVRLLSAYLDQVSELKLMGLAGPLVGDNVTLAQDGLPTNGSQLGADLGLVGLLSACYVSLGERTFAFDNESAAISAARRLNISTEVAWGVVHFHSLQGPNLSYTLTTQSNTRRKMSTLFLQSLLDAALVGQLSGRAMEEWDSVELKVMPEPCRKDPAIYTFASFGFGLLLGLGLAAWSYQLIVEMVAEKAEGLAEFLLIAGVSRVRLKLAWWLYGVSAFVPLSVLVALLAKYTVPRLVEFSELSVLLAFCGLYGLASLSLCFLLSGVMRAQNQAMGVYLLSSLVAQNLPSWCELVPDVGYTGARLLIARWGCRLHPVFAAAVGIHYVTNWEQKGEGVTWSTLFASPDFDDEFGGMGEVLVGLAIQIPLLFLLGVWLDQAVVGKYGIPQPFYYPLTRAYWLGPQRVEDGDFDEPADVEVDGQDAAVEPPSAKKVPGIVLRRLSKAYPNGKVAVEKLSVAFYENEITAFLGHNGAGKSTTMNVLTGMIPATSGDALMNGLSVRRQMPAIRRSLGYCPQYDIVYGDLTVAQHMRFYGRLKGMGDGETEAYSAALFEEMKLSQAVDTRAKDLSGGMRRKLSIAIAFLGRPKTIILDEPTSSIDPFSRRAIWDLILRYKAGATVLISTHYMQEADVLGDRTAIIHEGRLKCCGSPMFLKARFGKGCDVTLAHPDGMETTKLVEALRLHAPVTVGSSARFATTINVPLEVAKSKTMVQILEFLESSAGLYGIQSFGFSEATLEQVFFTVAGEEMRPQTSAKRPATAQSGRGPLGQPDEHREQSLHIQPHKPMGAAAHLAAQFAAVIVKRLVLCCCFFFDKSREEGQRLRWQEMRRSVAAFALLILAPMLLTAVLWGVTFGLAEANIAGSREKVSLDLGSPYQRQLFYAGPDESALLQALLTGGFIPSTEAWDEAVPVNWSLAASPPPLDPVANCSCQCGALNESARRVDLPDGLTLLDLRGLNVTDYLLRTPRDWAATIGGIQEVFEEESLFTSLFGVLDASEGAEAWCRDEEAGAFVPGLFHLIERRRGCQSSVRLLNDGETLDLDDYDDYDSYDEEGEDDGEYGGGGGDEYGGDDEPSDGASPTESPMEEDSTIISTSGPDAPAEEAAGTSTSTSAPEDDKAASPGGAKKRRKRRVKMPRSRRRKRQSFGDLGADSDQFNNTDVDDFEEFREIYETIYQEIFFALDDILHLDKLFYKRWSPKTLRLWAGFRPPGTRPTERQQDIRDLASAALNGLANVRLRSALRDPNVSLTTFAQTKPLTRALNVVEALQQGVPQILLEWGAFLIDVGFVGFS